MNQNKNSEDLIRLPHGVSDFKKLVQGNYRFVDKTLFIKDIINDGADVILVTRPRRFGKTLNLSMLYYFLKYQDEEEKGENLFQDLEIAKHKDFCQKHQHQYQVIFISFKDIKQTSYDKAYEEIVGLIRKLYSAHRYLLEDDLLHSDEKKYFLSILNKQAGESDVTDAIQQLSEYMSKKFKKSPIILIDEYDTPIQEAYLKNYYEDMIDSMTDIFGKALKDNDYLRKAIVTGITRVSQESLFSGVNNIMVYSLLREKYGQYFGFTESEVLKLIEDTKQKIHIKEIRKWYNGYLVGKYVLYNPWSIISCISNNGELCPYWINTSSNALIGKLLTTASDSVKHNLEKLLQKKSIIQPLFENLVFPDIKKRAGALWSLLLYAGYLKVLSTEIKNRKLIATLAVPNEEIFFVYDAVIDRWLEETVDTESYDKFLTSLDNGDLEKFKMYLSSYIMQSGSFFDFNSNAMEQTFHVFILGLVVGLRDRYYIYSNRESGIGRFDVILIPHDKQKRGILLEFKTASNDSDLQNKAKEALDQIKDQQYFEEFKQHKVNKILAIGLAFFSKQVELVYENINLR